jgi:YD repeat-containing protein
VYGYDQEGNLVSKLSFGDDSGDVALYTWDNRDRLVEVQKYDGHGTYDRGKKGGKKGTQLNR